MVNVAPCIERLLGLTLTPDQNWNAYFRAIAKMLEEMSDHCIALENTEFLLLCPIFIRVRTDEDCSMIAISGLVMHTPHNPALGVETRCRELFGDELFFHLQLLYHRRNVARFRKYFIITMYYVIMQ